MLDADEAASFDEAMRDDPELQKAYREISCITAAIAAASSTPAPPRTGQLERLQVRLGLNAAKRTNWLGISGWAAAAALTVIGVLERRTAPETSTASESVSALPSLAAIQGPADGSRAERNDPMPNSLPNDPAADDESVSASAAHQVKTITRIETKRLIQEIEVLRGKLESAQERDQKRFQAVDGMSWPIVMRMRPPSFGGSDLPSISKDLPELTSLLGDALAGNSGAVAAAEVASDLASSELGLRTYPLIEQATRGLELSGNPSAIPIYDAARDSGTLVVANLPEKRSDESYNLWVKTEDAEKPIHVGLLPDTAAAATESFDFSLGSVAIVPREFFLTKDAVGEPSAPTDANTVLQGPQ